jgi:hypothetical protein
MIPGRPPVGSVAKDREMNDPFNTMRDPLTRANRYQKVAGEYYDLAKAASSPFLRAYYQRTAEEYRVLAHGQLRVLERVGVSPVGRSAK